MAGKRAVLFANGEMASYTWAKRLITGDDAVIAADGGLNHCLAMALSPILLIGDLDSVTPQQTAAVQAAGCQVIRYPVEKNETDLELALLWAAHENYQSILIFAALGGRIDQQLANLTLLLMPELTGLDVCVCSEREEIYLITSNRTITGRAGDRVSLLPWGGPAVGVSTSGLRYPLEFETLSPQHSRGISNEMLADSAVVSLESGSLLCVHSYTGVARKDVYDERID